MPECSSVALMAAAMVVAVIAESSISMDMAVGAAASYLYGPKVPVTVFVA